MLPEVYETVKHEIPYYVGVYVLRENWAFRPCLKCEKKAQRQDRSRPVSEMLMMMWRSDRREVVKCRRTAQKLIEGETSGEV